MSSRYIDPSFDVKEYSSFGSPIDLVADGGPAHMLHIVGSGTITIVTAAGNSRTITVASGEDVQVRCKTISSVGGVSKVRAHFYHKIV